MNAQSSRRAFLRGDFRRDGTPVMRPFGAAGEDAFRDTCTGCGDCLRACPQGILAMERGLPRLDAALGACTFCGDCISACETPALAADRAWTWRAAADATCLSRLGVLCRACQDHCAESAIGFGLRPGGRAVPQFDTDRCTGCGGCAAPCPVGAIRFSQNQPTTEVRSC